MTIIEQIKAEIERLKKAQEVSEDKDYAQYELDVACGYDIACDDILSFLSALEPEKPMDQEGLDEEIIKCWQEWISPSNKQSVEGVLPLSEFAFYARHFVQWGAENLKK